MGNLWRSGTGFPLSNTDFSLPVSLRYCAMLICTFIRRTTRLRLITYKYYAVSFRISEIIALKNTLKLFFIFQVLNVSVINHGAYF